MSQLPKLACLCPTYNRPHLLPQALHSFLQQDYPADRCELIILDDAGQYVSQSHAEPKPWTLISYDRRFRSMGEKRNCTAALCSRDVDAFVLWDDDDIYLPWTLRAHATALEHSPWSRPSQIFIDRETYLETKDIQYMFHACWAFTRDMFAKVRGYPFIQSGQDAGLMKSFRGLNIESCDPLQYGHLPYFIYRWDSVDCKHLSNTRGDGGYYDLQQALLPQAEPIRELKPYWPVDYTTMAMEEGDVSQTAQIFTEIYDKWSWGGKKTRSGEGSEIEATVKIRAALPRIVEQYGVKTFLDLPCGDFAWMQNVELGVEKYIGADIVRPLIRKNRELYKHDFRILDLLTDNIPQVDMVFCRDCLVHLSLEDLRMAIANIVRSGSTYLMSTTFPGRANEKVISTGQWTPYNLQAAPISLPPPLELVNEDCRTHYPKFNDKSMGIWKVSDLAI